MSKRRKNGWNPERNEKGGYVPIPHCVIRSHGFGKLSAYAVKLLIDLLSQYYGSNNGDLHATFSLLRKRGWKSKGTLNKAIKELIESGFAEISRQGGRNKCSLYAVTFYAIDDCKGKLDIQPTSRPTSLWKKNEPIPDIEMLQRQKKEQDDKKFMKVIMDKAKREYQQNFYPKYGSIIND